MGVYTTTQLVADVRRRAMLPNTNSLGTLDADILAAADTEMESRLYPLVMKLQEEYFLAESLLTFTDGANFNMSDIRIPQDAWGNKLRDVTWVNNTGTWTNMPRINLEDEWESTPYVGTSIPRGFMLFNDHIRFLPRGNYNQGRALIRYYRRPYTLGGTVERYCITPTYPASMPNAQLLAEYLINIVPTGSFTGGQYAFFMAESPYELIGVAPSITAGATTYQMSIRWSGNLSMMSGIACVRIGSAATTWPTLPYGTDNVVCPFIQLPNGYNQLLVQRTVCRMLQAQRDQVGLAIAEADADRMEKALVAVTGERVDGQPQRVRGGIRRNIANTGYVYNV